MYECIAREAAIAAIMSEKPDAHYPQWYADKMKAIPSADVAPVLHGKWGFKVGMNIYRERDCLVCKKHIKSNFWNFCPNCGAKMDGDGHGG